MSRSEESWIAEVREHASELRALLTDWHPVNLASREARGKPQPAQPGPITAGATEAACVAVRAQIARDREGDPVRDFDEALAAGQVGRIYRLLSDTWFGVPESRDCWQIVGFKVAVDLMDDPPDEHEEES